MFDMKTAKDKALAALYEVWKGGKELSFGCKIKYKSDFGEKLDGTIIANINTSAATEYEYNIILDGWSTFQVHQTRLEIIGHTPHLNNFCKPLKSEYRYKLVDLWDYDKDGNNQSDEFYNMFMNSLASDQTSV